MPTRPTLIVASRNAKKRREIEDLLAPHNIEVHSVTDFPDVPEVIEDGETFADNAAKKATQTAQHLNRWVLGEDSGLMVDALNGAPGVYSARFSGEDATDDKNNAKLMAELANVPDERRGAQYLCHTAISDPTGAIRLTVEATCRGRIIREPRGSNGFGYDPYFLIPEYHLTFGELSSTVKQHLSHRARAFERLIIPLVRLLSSE
ncbi:MAG: XTP/dITP diphosphatase [Planctomycetaceae bacterium]|nr:XTP/dITP diphosphatase [Planctomycetaceae bacterium]